MRELYNEICLCKMYCVVCPLNFTVLSVLCKSQYASSAAVEPTETQGGNWDENDIITIFILLQSKMAEHYIVLSEKANGLLLRSNILKMLKSGQNTLLFMLTVLLLRVCDSDGQYTVRMLCTKNNNILSLYQTGYIDNPEYYNSEQYVRRTCTWLINTSKGKRIKLEFKKIVIRYSQDCSKDYLQVYDGDSTDSTPITSKLCGHNSGIEPVYSEGRSMTVFFHSMNSLPFRQGRFTLYFYSVDSEFFNVGTMVAIVAGVILVIVNALVFRYYCRRRQNRRQQRRRIARHRTQQRTRSEHENGPVTQEETGVVGSNVDEPPSYNDVMQNPSQNPRPQDVLEIPHLPPPTYPGTDEPETPPPPYPGVVQQPPQYPSPRENQQRI